MQQDGNNAALNRHALIVGARLCGLNGTYGARGDLAQALGRTGCYLPTKIRKRSAIILCEGVGVSLRTSYRPDTINRTTAAECGLFRFNTGRPCKAGHFSERFVSNRQCVACNGVKARQRDLLRGFKDPPSGCIAMCSAAPAWFSGAAPVPLMRLAATIPSYATISPLSFARACVGSDTVNGRSIISSRSHRLEP